MGAGVAPPGDTARRFELAEHVDRLDVPFVMRTMSSVGPSIAYDHGSPVAAAYADRRDGFPFAGVLHELTVEIVSRVHDADAAAAEARVTMGRQ